MQSSECDNMDEKLGQDRNNHNHHALETGSGAESPHPDSLPISPVNQEGSETITVETNSASLMVTHQDQKIQCDLDEKCDKAAQTSNDGSLPTRSRLAILVVCTCMAIFLQALVSRRDGLSWNCH